MSPVLRGTTFIESKRAKEKRKGLGQEKNSEPLITKIVHKFGLCMHETKILHNFVPDLREIYLFGKIAFSAKLWTIKGTVDLQECLPENHSYAHR